MAATKKKTPAKKSAGKKKNQTSKKKRAAEPRISSTGAAIILTICAIALFLLFICVPPGGSIGGAGILLQYIVKLFTALIGLGRFVLPFYLLLLAYAFFRKKSSEFRFLRFLIFASLLFIVFPTFFSIDQDLTSFGGFMKIAAAGEGGGVIGGFFAYCLLILLTEPVSVVLLVILGVFSLLMLTNFSWGAYFARKKEHLDEKRAAKKEAKELAAMERAEEEEEEADPLAGKNGRSFLFDDGEEPALQKEEIRAVKSKKKRKDPVPGKKRKKVVEYAGNDRVIIDGMIFTKDIPSEDYTPVTFREHLTGKSEIDDLAPTVDDEKDPDMGLTTAFLNTYSEEEIHDDEPVKESKPKKKPKYAFEEEKDEPAETVFEDVVESPAAKKVPASLNEEKEGDLPKNPADSGAVSHFCLPKTDILTKGDKKNQKKAAEDIRSGVAKLERTLESFGVQARVTEVSCGPSLIRYEVQPGPGVKVSKIVNLADDIALQLAAADVRMEAPIPGKSVIGIEVPRKDSVSVYFRDILENSRFFDMPSKLTCAYGQDIAGNPVIGDLAAMPHLLIAGTTGSGKSVCMNTMICSILFKATPDEVKFIMIDPKQVEFVIYEGLPHLITPVVTDPKKAAGALKWALREMENRYTLFNQNRVRNLVGYNELVEKKEDRLPQIVIFIDELADLMMVAAKDVEASICRLAQKARAAGIHLVIATQRPSVDVITGLIKANIPSRIALSVSSQTDSRTILDVGGAEKLLGKGDMLYMPIGYSKPLRVQGAWLSDADAVAILDHYKNQGEPDYVEGVAQAVETGGKKEEAFGDALFFDAARAAITAGQASTSMMQRRFRIGYNHAARIMEELEEKGVIGPADGAKPRTVLMSLEVFKETFKEPQEQSLFEE